jgi:cytochrome c oxidase assembly factor 6
MSDTGSKPPTRQERKRCWFVRDEYFGCLDTLNINDPTVVEKNPEKATKCLELKKGYEEGCMASWVSSSPFNRLKKSVFNSYSFLFQGRIL